MRASLSRWLSFLIALLLIPVAIGVTVFITRSASINCRRAGGQVSCAENEHIGPYPAWSASVEHVAIARAMGVSESGPSGVFIETEAGDTIQFTSNALDTNQQNTVADRIHQFLFVRQDQTELNFDLSPSLRNLGLGALFTLAMLLWALFSAFQIIRHARKRKA